VTVGLRERAPPNHLDKWNEVAVIANATQGIEASKNSCKPFQITASANKSKGLGQ
jgi:hypothetical protein